MAVAAYEVNVVAGQDHAIGVERKVIVDKELGIAAEVENVAVAVDLGDGRVGVVTQQKIIGVQAQPSTVSHSICPCMCTMHCHSCMVHTMLSRTHTA